MQCAGSISGARGRGQGGALVVNESTFEESASSTQTVADASRNTSLWGAKHDKPGAFAAAHGDATASCSVLRRQPTLPRRVCLTS